MFQFFVCWSFFHDFPKPIFTLKSLIVRLTTTALFITMSDHPREAVRNLKRIYICDDVWYGVFGLSERAVLGIKIAPICARFDGLADGHFRTIRWSLGNIEFRREENGTRAKVFKHGEQENNGVVLAESALLDVPPPPNLIGFNRIQIDYVDQSVVAFLRRICQHLNNADIRLELPLHVHFNNRRLFVTHIWPLIAPRLQQLARPSILNLNQLRTLVSPTVLRDCANLIVIYAGKHVFPVMPADDGADASVDRAVAMWLHTPRSDGRPKVLKCLCRPENIARKSEGLKRAFVSADLPVSFIICAKVFNPFNHPFVGEPFECENQRTRERMTFQECFVGPCLCWLLKRGPILWGESEWADSERRAKVSHMDLYKEMPNFISSKNIKFDDTCFV